jgi:hypothetical protein
MSNKILIHFNNIWQYTFGIVSGDRTGSQEVPVLLAVSCLSICKEKLSYILPSIHLSIHPSWILAGDPGQLGRQK